MTKLRQIFDQVEGFRREADLSLFQKAHEMLKVVPDSARKYVEAMCRKDTYETARSWPHKPEHFVAWFEKVKKEEEFWNNDSPSGCMAEVRTRYDGFSLQGTFGWKDEYEAVAAIKELAEAWEKDFGMSYKICYRDPENDLNVKYGEKPEGYVLDCICVNWKLKR